MAKNDFFFNEEVPQNHERKAAVRLILDTSGSMAGEPLKELLNGISSFKEQVQNDPTANSRLELGISTFNSRVEDIQDFVSMDQMEIPVLEATGTTKMVDGVREGIKSINDRKAWYKNNGLSHYRPFAILITDGWPDNDQDIEALSQEIREGVDNKHFRFWAFGVEGADMDVLKKISHPEFPPQKLKGLEFVKFFKWLSNSMSVISNSRPDEKVDLTPAKEENPFLLTV